MPRGKAAATTFLVVAEPVGALVALISWDPVSLMLPSVLATPEEPAAESAESGPDCASRLRGRQSRKPAEAKMESPDE